MNEPLAGYYEVRPNGRRWFELFADRVIVKAKSVRADSVVTVLLADLRPEPNCIRLRPREFALGFGLFLVALGLAFFAIPTKGFTERLEGSKIVLSSAAVGFLFVSLAIMLMTYRKIEFAQFVSNYGRVLLDVARAGPQRAEFASFVETLIAQIRANHRSGKINLNANPYSVLRNFAFSKTRTEVGLAQPDANAPAWGVVMEMVVHNVVPLTLLSLADGTTSMYLGSGAAVIGGHSHEHVRQAAAAFLAQANALHFAFEPTAAAPPPLPGRVAFYARTDGGLLKADAAESELPAGIHPLSPLYFAAHNVIAELRKTTE